MDQDLKKDYAALLNTPEWRHLKVRVISERGYRCELCGVSPARRQGLVLHHLTYQHMREFRPQDVQLLCRHCHIRADEERAKRGKARSAAALYAARLDGWASRKYGEDWAEDPVQAEFIEEEFDEWLETKEENDWWG